VTRALAAVGLACALAACSESPPFEPPRVDLAFVSNPDLGMCPALDIAFDPQWIPPNGPYTGQCIPSQIDLLVALVAKQGPAGLQSFVMQQGGVNDCAACLDSGGQITQLFGPFTVRASGVLDGNVGGCVALLEGDGSAESCGAAVQAQADCLADACAGCPTVNVAGDLVAYDRCLADAAGGVCAVYAAGASCADRDPAAAKCRSTSWSSPVDWVRFMAELFCGTRQTDM
jgi:hypothetical protein